MHRLRRRSRVLRTRRATLIVAVTLIAVAATAMVASAVTLTPKSGHNLVAVGPISGENGFPESYTDDTGTRLELCLDPATVGCSAAAPLPNPDAPMSFPDNYPDEAFYSLASAGLTTGTAGRATLTLAAEAAFANGDVIDGDQITFGRVRIRASGLTDGATYKVTHPYGVDEFVASGGTINFTEDVGIGAAGVFTGMLNSRLGPFLRWDTGAPDGYLGDPAVDHKITGSPYNTNVFKIEGPNAGGTGVNVAQTDLFSVMGKKATNSGVDAVRASYSRAGGASGGTIDVYATSEPEQSLQVSGANVDDTRLEGNGRRYFARVAYTGSTPPTEVTVTNVGDNPQAKKTIPVKDLVTVTKASYSTTTHDLTVEASSSDGANPTLTAEGFGTVSATPLPAGTTPPPDVTVTSQAGGSTTVPVAITGDAMAAIPVQAFAGVAQTVQQGQSVTLDGSGSTGPVKSYGWEQLTGPTVSLTGTDKAKATFTAPSAATDLTFRLTVTGPGGPSTSEATVHVAAVQTPVANAGPDRTVAQNTLVQLDGTGSTNATGYQWVAPTGVTLTGANTATPSFTFPKQTTPLTFTLTVTGPGGTSAPDTVTISPALDTLATSKVRFITSKNQWEIVGTATSTLNNTITIHQGSTLSGAVIGKATVDALGAWTFKGPGTTATTISIESARGGQRLAIPVDVR
jgi:K319-like protein